MNNKPSFKDLTIILNTICRNRFAGLSEPTGIIAPSTGKFNDSLFFTLDGRDYVFRMAPDENQGFLFYERNMMAQEPKLHEIIREKTDIPVAEILMYDDSRTIAPRPYLIMEKLAGVPLSQARHANESEVFRQVGRYLKQLHDITSDRYGYLGEHHPMEPADDWCRAFEVMWNLLLDDIVACEGYSIQEADRFRRLFDRDRELFDRDVPSSLLHMDIWHENILVGEDGQVTGIVDWDRALWGDVEIEYAVLDYCGVSAPAFWQGYGRERNMCNTARRRGVYYTLYELQKYIVIRKARNGLPGEAGRYRRVALQIADQMD